MVSMPVTVPDRPPSTRRRPRRWDLVALSIGAVTATLSILFWAWLNIWFQLFGEQPDRADYLNASGLYAGGLFWLTLAAALAWFAKAPPWLGCWCLGADAVFAVLLVRARSEAADRELRHDIVGNSFAGGFETAVAYMPWNWLILAAAVLALISWHRGELSEERGAP